MLLVLKETGLRVSISKPQRTYVAPRGWALGGCSGSAAWSLPNGLASVNGIGSNGAWHMPWPLCGGLSSGLVSYGPLAVACFV